MKIKIATKTTPTLLGAIVLGLGQLLMTPVAHSAQLQNYASYQVLLSHVESANSAATVYQAAADTQASYTDSPSLPVPVHVIGGADTGVNMDGLGYANGLGFASAEAGILKAYSIAEAQATAQPASNVGAGATVTSLAEYTDLATFTSSTSTYQNLLIITGELLLSGDMYKLGGGFGEVKVGGTGLNPLSTSAEWVGDSNGRIKTAAGVYSYGWAPGSDVSIPFSFTAYSGQATELTYWLSTYASAGGSFEPCTAIGELCETVQTSEALLGIDYSHTLAWGGVSVTDWFGTPVNFTSSSLSGFDYATAYSAPTVPVPAAVWLFGSGLLGLVGVARRKTI
jgi:hypothetical protein